ncbi:hypothetical protein BH762_gp048 [Gordonia phage OneUp]|uniref:Uncharacterized protein n=1 Tax=Gordonia phage OneUp TaxID=1838074 RepID=A0A160DEV3_9CAUD|nr:hypothetical protein BH762_gp048 [Gordonia phage OneUp]ANA86470.1 hypothetical protein PBI_ONEUP_137 [Gordonia phage OneUp]
MTVIKERRKYERLTEGVRIYIRNQAMEGKTTQEISDATNIPPGTVWKVAHDVIQNQQQPRGRQDITIQDVLSAIDGCGSMRKAAKELGCSLTVVRQRLWEAGMGPDPKNRGRSKPRARDEVKED